MTFKQGDSRRAPTWDETDPARAAQLHAHTDLDRETYTRAGFQPVDCQNCSSPMLFPIRGESFGTGTS